MPSPRQVALHAAAVANQYHGRKREVLLLLASAVRNADGEAVISARQIAARAGCSERHARRLRSELLAEGALDLVAPGGGRLRGGRGRAPRYRVRPAASTRPGRPPVQPTRLPFGYPDIGVRPYSSPSRDKSVVGSTRAPAEPVRPLLHSEKRWCDVCGGVSGWLYRDDGSVDPCPACR